MGAATVVAGPTTGGTDHESFQAVGLPGFQFIQDPLDYESRVHHSSIDTLDHLKADDLRQAAVVLAGMLLRRPTATRSCRARRCRPSRCRPIRSSTIIPSRNRRCRADFAENSAAVHLRGARTRVMFLRCNGD